MLSLCLFAGCTVIETDPLAYDPNLGTLKIKNNPKVIVPDFLDVMHANMSERGIKYQMVGETYAPKQDEYVVTYNALRSWDFVAYLTVADVWIHKNDKQVAKGHFHLENKGGLTFSKFDDNDEKLKPMYDELFKNYGNTPAKP